LGINPFATRSRRDHYVRPILDQYSSYEGKTVTIAGRLMLWRKQGAMAFGQVQDQTGTIQIILRRDTLKETSPSDGNIGYADVRLMDVGDIIEAHGPVGKSLKGEISVMTTELRILTKAIRPLPDKWSGLQDREMVLRKRYLDTVTSPERIGHFEAISKMVSSAREFLNQRGFLEFTTPIIQPQYGGGTARPFTTHVNALGCDMYLAISHELYLKRLITAGFDKVYTIGRYFRNEGIDRSHHPEFSMIETMTAYENYEYNMELVEGLFRHLATSVFKKSVFNVRGHQVDFAQPWKRISMLDALRQVTNIDFGAIPSLDEANAALASLGIHEAQTTIGAAMLRAFEERVQPTLIQPAIVYGHPAEVSPLAKPMPSDPRFVERFEIFVAGMELGDNWTEQNDPEALLERWRMAQAARTTDELGESEIPPLDYDFIETLEYGMPPTTGIGPGIERMAMIFTEEEDIYNVIFFPLMKPTLSTVNKAIYGVEDGAEVRRAAPEHPEDVFLTKGEFEELIRQGVFRPASKHITITPVLRIWKRHPSPGPWMATGYLELDGFTEHGRVVITGYNTKTEEKPDAAGASQRFLELCQASVVGWINELFPGTAVAVHNVKPQAV
jgi:lysyl-tRNA synthetase class 2